MTNVVVWRVPPTDEVWAIADTRVSHPGVGGAPLQTISDRAVKILPVEIKTFEGNTTTGEWAPAQTTSVGFAYAGSALVGLMTHAALNVFLGKVCGVDVRLPSILEAANLCRFLAESYTRDVAFGNPRSANTEICLFGWCREKNAYQAFHIRPSQSASQFAMELSEVDLRAGSRCILGTDSSALGKEIETVTGSAHRGVEPRIALARRLVKESHDGVGGTLQVGIANKRTFEIKTSAFTIDTNEDGVRFSGGGALHYLGFGLADDIDPHLGGQMVLIPGIL